MTDTFRVNHVTNRLKYRDTSGCTDTFHENDMTTTKKERYHISNRILASNSLFLVKHYFGMRKAAFCFRRLVSLCVLLYNVSK